MTPEERRALEKEKKELAQLQHAQEPEDQQRYHQLAKEYKEHLTAHWSDLTPSDRVMLARQPGRPNGRTFIQALCTQFVELHGDRLGADDPTVVGGIALFQGIPVTVIALCKGENPTENLYYNFGMANPAGYRKIQRLVRQAEKFSRPILTFIDTPGAYPGIQAEEQGQGEAIASCLALFSSVTVPVIATVTGEGGSGGALAVALANRVLMLENAVYAILSPEGFATILWKDGKRKEEAAGLMRLTAQDLLQMGIIDGIIPEGLGGIMENPAPVMMRLSGEIQKALGELSKLGGPALAKDRYDRFRKMGNTREGTSKNI